MASHNDVIGNEADETSPLLGREEWQPATRSNPASQQQLQKPWRIALVLCLGMFLGTVSSGYAMYPEMQLSEDVMCKKYHLRNPHTNDTSPHDSFPGHWIGFCDVPGVTERVSNLLTLRGALTAVVGMLVAYPFGVLADKIGRRPVYALAAAGQSAAILWSLIVYAGWRVLPLELVLIAPVFQLFGGGMAVGTAVLYAILSDVMPAQSRTAWFFLLAAAAMVGVQVSISLHSELTTHWTPWGALIVSIILGLLNASLMLLIPESLKLDPTEEEILAERITIAEAREAFVRRTAFREHVSEAWSSLGAIIDNRSIALILLMLVILAIMYQELVVLYILDIYNHGFEDRRFPFTVALPISNIASLVMIAIFFPLLTHLLTPSRSGLSYFRRDLLLARISAAFVPVGLLLLAMPNMAVIITGLAIFTLSVGLRPLLQSLLTHYVDSGNMARVFALVGALRTVQSFVTNPFFSWLSRESAGLPAFWMGLPFLVLAALGVVVVASVWLIKGEVFVEWIQRDRIDEDAHVLDEEAVIRDNQIASSSVSNSNTGANGSRQREQWDQEACILRFVTTNSSPRFFLSRIDYMLSNLQDSRFVY
ncbi:putative Major facilitator superfamily domain-containing protein [Seiridium cardinale]